MGRADEIVASFKKMNKNPNVRFYNGTHLSISETGRLFKVFKGVELVVVVDCTPRHEQQLQMKMPPGIEGFINLTSNSAGFMYKENQKVVDIVKLFILAHLDTDHECPICCTDCDAGEILHCSSCYNKICPDCYEKVSRCPSCRMEIYK